MQIAILASGSRGDVQPYLALAVGLKNAGHQVRFVTHDNFGAWVKDYGIDFWPIDVDVQQIAQSSEMRARVEQGNFLSLMARMAKEAQRGAVQLAEGSLAACQGVDLLLAGMGGLYTALALAEKMDLPVVQAYLVPFTPTQYFSSVLAPNMPAWLGGTARRWSHHLTRQLIWQGFRSADTLARRKVLGLPDASFWGPYNSPHTYDLPVLYGFSPSVVPVPKDWGEHTYVTGYWFLDPVKDWQPPSALTDFLKAGPPPVYIGFGSMGSRNPEETASLVVEALRQTRQRAILLSGWGGLRSGDLPESILMIDSTPHAWLFPRMAAVVHHGGAGTTAAGLRVGVPAAVIPFFGDQLFWGRRIAALGVGPEPIPRKKLTAERLAEAISQMVNDGNMRRRAADLGEKIRAENGVARAADIIDDIIGDDIGKIHQ